MDKPEVSIITPTYNHKNFIIKCISSVKEQTYGNWEQIIIDDASTDGSRQTVSNFIKEDKRIRLVEHKNRFGISRLNETYNEALNLARGKYIAILEGDDYWPENKLEIQLNALKDKHCVLSFGDCIMTNSKTLPIKLFTYHFSENHQKNIDSIDKFYAILRYSIIPVTAVIEKNSLVNIGGFQKNAHYPFCDIPTFLKIALKGDFLYVNEVLGFYRKQQDSSWYRFVKTTNAMGRKEVIKCAEDFFTKNKKNPQIINLENKINLLMKNQQQYLKKKKFMKPLSLRINSYAFRPQTTLLTLLFYYHYLVYKLEKIIK